MTIACMERYASGGLAGPRSSSRMSRTHPHDRTGFTLTELMVVISVVGVLLSFLIVSLSNVQGSAQATVDLTNQGQIVKANNTFALDNKGRLFHPRTNDELYTGDLNDEARDRMWVRDYAYSDPGNIDSSTGWGTVEALNEGAAWDYIGNADIYKSPLDPTLRLRSYSLNSFIGVNKGADDNSTYGTVTPPPYLGSNYLPCPTVTGIRQPSRTMGCIIEENQDGNGDVTNNLHGFLVHPGTGTGVFIPYWIDAPAIDWDPGKVHLAFMDGSTYTYVLSDYRQLSDDLVGGGETSIASPDYIFFRDIMLPGRLSQ